MHLQHSLFRHRRPRRPRTLLPTPPQPPNPRRLALPPEASPRPAVEPQRRPEPASFLSFSSVRGRASSGSGRRAGASGKTGPTSPRRSRRRAGRRRSAPSRRSAAGGRTWSHCGRSMGRSHETRLQPARAAGPARRRRWAGPGEEVSGGRRDRPESRDGSRRDREGRRAVLQEKGASSSSCPSSSSSVLADVRPAALNRLDDDPPPPPSSSLDLHLPVPPTFFDLAASGASGKVGLKIRCSGCRARRCLFHTVRPSPSST